MHAAELPVILKGGARVLYISNEHPDVLERLAPSSADEQKVRAGMRRLKDAKLMQVTSAAGTDLQIRLEGARVGGVWGYTEKPGTLSHWPGGLCLCFPRADSVNGTLVIAPGDLNPTFKRYAESPVRLAIEDDYVTRIEGESLDAELMRAYFAGNFLYSTGANEFAGRHTLGHFDLPFRRCTVALDGDAVVREGKLVA